MHAIFNWVRARYARLRAGVRYAIEHPAAAFEEFLTWLWYLARRAAQFVRDHTRWMTRRFWYVVAGLAEGMVLLYSALFMYLDSRLVPVQAVDEVRLLGQGWGAAPESADRKRFYFTPQGAYLRDMRYDWLGALERPWRQAKFAAPENMRAYGFIVEPTAMPENPGNLPIGFAPSYTAGEVMLDITCAACHTGELQVIKDGKRVGVRIDGGPGMHDFTSVKPGHFGSDLIASLAATYINPLKWRRFSRNVLGVNNTWAAQWRLHGNVRHVLGNFARQAWIDGTMHLYPVEEGYGRTDALGRIANNVFGTNLSDRNYRVGNAPVSYPAVWDIYKFDWVQYNGSVRQPMARNIGESMGVGARYFLVDPYERPVPKDQRYDASTLVPNLHAIELSLRKLQPPCWPEDLLGPIDWTRARKGRDLFQQHCRTCHGPHPADVAMRKMYAPGKIAQDVPHWMMKLLPVEDVGTDPTAALNFVRHRVDLTASGLTAEEVRKALEPVYLEKYKRQVAYCNETQAAGAAQYAQYQQDGDGCADVKDVKPEEYLERQFAQMNLSDVSVGAGLNYLITFIRARAYRYLDVNGDRSKDFDGFDQLDTPQVVAKYKARPLAGVWATAPYLHNGSVPTLYEMLLPAYQRKPRFYVRDRTFDANKVGIVTQAASDGAFLFDTTIPGNWNTGHEFRAGYRPWKEGNRAAYGVIGPELKDEERCAIVEYLKVHRDDGNESCPGQPADFTAVKPPVPAKGTRQ